MTVWERISAHAKLITLPEVYLKLKALLEQPAYAMADVALAIGQDPALTARLLRLVNSPYFGLTARIETVFRAVNMLGTKQVHDLALATSVAQSFSGMSNEVMDMPRFWRKSVFCALAARLLARACNVRDCERLFVAGLLRDIGHLVMYQSIPELSEQAELQARETQKPVFLVERELTGIDYARVGGVLMRQWQLPESLRNSTEFHVEPARVLDFKLETFLVHVATLLTEAVASGEEFGVGMLQPHPDTWSLTGLSLEDCHAIQNEADCEAESVSKLMIS